MSDWEKRTQSIAANNSKIVAIDLSQVNNASSQMAGFIQSLLKEINNHQSDKTASLLIVTKSDTSNPQASIVFASIKGLAGSAALEFARHGGRVNLLLVSDESIDSDITSTIEYLDREESGGFTTGNTIDLTKPIEVHHKTRRVLVTGAAGGLGFAAAKSFSAAGYEVLMTDLPGERLLSAANELGAIAIPANLGSEAEIENLLLEVSNSGHIDSLVLHHGVGGSTWLGDDFDGETAARSIKVNGESFLSIVRLFEQSQLCKNVSVVCLSSIAGLIAEAGHAAYSSPKFAVVEMVRQLAPSLAQKNVSIHALCPGPIRTALMEVAFAGLAKGVGMDPQEFTEKRLSAIPLGDAGTTQQVGDSALFLSELKATGVELSPTGGEVIV